MQITIDLRGLKPALVDRLMADLTRGVDGPGVQGVGDALAVSLHLAAGVQERVTVDVPLEGLSDGELDRLCCWWLAYATSFAESRWPQVARLVGQLHVAAEGERLARTAA